jgi:hypothetical protein
MDKTSRVLLASSVFILLTTFVASQPPVPEVNTDDESSRIENPAVEGARETDPDTQNAQPQQNNTTTAAEENNQTDTGQTENQNEGIIAKILSFLGL